MASTRSEDGRIPLLLIHGAWLSARSWENYADFQPVHPKMNGSNVTPLRNGTTHQPPQTAIRRGGSSGGLAKARVSRGTSASAGR